MNEIKDEIFIKAVNTQKRARLYWVNWHRQPHLRLSSVIPFNKAIP